MRLFRVLLVGCLAAFLGVAHAVTVRLSPGSATIATTDYVDFTAVVTGTSNTAVRWTVSSGRYTVISANKIRFDPPDNASTYYVTATSVQDSRARAVASVRTVVVPIRVTMTPTSTFTWPGRAMDFTVSISGTSNTGIRWSVDGGRLTILASNKVRYTPGPSGTFTLIARSQANSLARAVSTIRVFPVPVSLMKGTILRRGTNIGLPNVVIRFVYGSNNLAAWTRTDRNGKYAVFVPTNVFGFRIDRNSLPTGPGGSRIYYSAYEYYGQIFESNIVQCRSPLPRLRAAFSYTLPPIRVFVASGPPPPPPAGCR
jgi:hypothetical protein